MQEQQGRNAAKDLATGVILTLFGIYVIIASLNMKVYNTFIDAPGFFPLIIGVVIAALGALLAFIGLKAGGVAELKEVCTGTFMKAFFTDDRTVRVLVLFGMMVIYIFVLIGRLHFILSSTIYLVATFLYLKACKHWWMSIIIAVIASAAAYYAFRFGFGITMP